MGERIDLPQTPQGTAEEQLRQMYSYLYRMAEALNHNLSEIGSMDLTDDERIIMQQITAEEEGAEAAAYDWQGKESLKSLIIKTAEFVQNKLDNYRLNLLGEYVTEGKFGKYVRNTSLKVDVTPTGIQQDFTFEEVVQGLKNYTVNAKNYIKTGMLRTVGGVPVYGVAIGKDVVTFAQDGTETYNDGNKVAELTADELSFYQNGSKVASYKGNRISFLINGTEVFYIESGKIHSNIDLELSSGKKLIINTSNFKVDSNGNVEIIGSIKAGSTFAGTMSANCITSGSIDASVIEVKNINASKISTGTLDASVVTVKNIDASKITTGTMSANKISGGSIDASNVTITNLNASNITSGTMSANKISGGSIDASNVTINNLDASKITTGSMSAARITSGTMSADRISGGTLVLGGNNNTNGIMQIKNGSGTVVGTFNKDGISYAGNMSITSGGTFSVDSTNFKIDSTNKKLVSGSWTLDNIGLKLTSGTGNNICEFTISEAAGQRLHFQADRPNTGNSAGWYLYEDGSIIPHVSDGLQIPIMPYIGDSSHAPNIYYTNLYQGSSKDIKHDIQTLTEMGEKIDQLNPVTFVYDNDALEQKHCGLIYEDTEGVIPEICTGNEGNKAINYVELIPMLVKEIQDLRRRVRELEERE